VEKFCRDGQATDDNMAHPHCMLDTWMDFSPLSTGALYGRSQRVTIPDAVKIQFRPPEDEHSIARNMSRYLT
jgi:hypothetical protein